MGDSYKREKPGLRNCLTQSKNVHSCIFLCHCSPSHEDLKALIAQAHRSVYKCDSSPIITDLIDNIMSIPSCLQVPTFSFKMLVDAFIKLRIWYTRKKLLLLYVCWTLIYLLKNVLHAKNATSNKLTQLRTYIICLVFHVQTLLLVNGL
jgi:hypothetical protein